MNNEAVFTSLADARAAADAAMPRRKHRRPHPVGSGWHWARAVACPECGAVMGTDCNIGGRVHASREKAARAAGRAADRWIVMAQPNAVLLTDGTMYDYARQRVIRA